MSEVPEYDAYDFRRPRGKRISKITGRATKLTEETETQIACVVHYDKRCELDRYLKAKTRLYAVNPVPGKSFSQAVLSKRMGLRPGIFDLCLLDRRKGFRIVWIEVKAESGGLTKEQSEYAEWLTGTPIETCVVRDLNEFIKILGD